MRTILSIESGDGVGHGPQFLPVAIQATSPDDRSWNDLSKTG